MVIFANKSRVISARSSSSFVVGIAEPRFPKERQASEKHIFNTSSLKSMSSSSFVSIPKQTPSDVVDMPALRVPATAADSIYAVSTPEVSSIESLQAEIFSASDVDMANFPAADNTCTGMNVVTAGNIYPYESARLSLDDVVNGTVDLSYTRLTCILPQIAQFKDITHLIISHNRLTWLPDDIGHLHHIQRVDISHNQLETLPATIVYWKSLNILRANSNRIARLPLSIRHLPQLNVIDLAENQLESVPAGLCSLTGLRSLDLSHNPIRVLPARLFGPVGAVAQNTIEHDVLILDGCPIGSGFVDHIDKPSTVFISRFSHAVATQDPANPAQSSRKLVPSLIDIVVCKMANSNAAYPHGLPEHIQARLDNLMVCDYCHKLYPAAAGTRRWRLVYRNRSVWPIEYSFCSPHWSTEKQRIATLFAPRQLEASQPYHAAKQAAADLVQHRYSQTLYSRKHIFSTSHESAASTPTASTAVKKALRRVFRTDRLRSLERMAPVPIWQVFEDDIPDLPDLGHIL